MIGHEPVQAVAIPVNYWKILFLTGGKPHVGHNSPKMELID
jgi:hypothetical protein